MHNYHFSGTITDSFLLYGDIGSIIMNTATLSPHQRRQLEIHQRQLKRAQSPVFRFMRRLSMQRSFLNTTATILVFFLIVGISFQSSASAFDKKTTAILEDNRSIADQAQDNSVRTTNKSTSIKSSSKISPTPSTEYGNNIPAGSILPATDEPSEDIPSQATQYTATGYAYGQCTWYVSHRRPIPQNWGNARDWLPRSKAAGFTSGKNARPGAIGHTPVGRYGHVVYVEQVQDGKVYVSEMNYVGWNRLSYRWVDESEFSYIY